jgi:hypothetical protein
MTRVPAAPTPSGGVGKIGEAVVAQILQLLRDAPVTLDSAPRASGRDGSNASSPAPASDTKIIGQLRRLMLDLIRGERRQVKQASTACLVGTILLWASVIFGIALELILITWLILDMTHPSSHTDLVPPIASTVANAACSGAAACVVRRFGKNKSNKSAIAVDAIEAALDVLRNLEAIASDATSSDE